MVPRNLLLMLTCIAGAVSGLLAPLPLLQPAPVAERGRTGLISYVALYQEARHQGLHSVNCFTKFRTSSCQKVVSGTSWCVPMLGLSSNNPWCLPLPVR